MDPLKRHNFSQTQRLPSPSPSPEQLLAAAAKLITSHTHNSKRVLSPGAIMLVLFETAAGYAIFKVSEFLLAVPFNEV